MGDDWDACTGEEEQYLRDTARLSESVQLVDRRLGIEELSALEQVERDIFLATQFDFEATCGGMHQVCMSRVGLFLLEVAESLRNVGAPKTAQLVDSVVALFPDGNYPLPIAEHENLLNGALGNRVADCECEVADEPLHPAVYEYWRHSRKG